LFGPTSCRAVGRRALCWFVESCWRGAAERRHTVIVRQRVEAGEVVGGKVPLQGVVDACRPCVKPASPYPSTCHTARSREKPRHSGNRQSTRASGHFSKIAGVFLVPLPPGSPNFSREIKP
jgi:hypothetical protein